MFASKTHKIVIESQLMVSELLIAGIYFQNFDSVLLHLREKKIQVKKGNLFLPQRFLSGCFFVKFAF